MFDPLRCHEPRGAMSCGSPMPQGEQIAKPAEGRTARPVLCFCPSPEEPIMRPTCFLGAALPLLVALPTASPTQMAPYKEGSVWAMRSEEHTSELQSRLHLV